MAKRSLLPVTLLLLAGSIAVALPLCAQGAAPSTPPAYDVVAIKPHDPSDGSTRIITQPDGYTASNVGLKLLIQIAYKLQTPDLISGLPAWANSARFDIQAKMDEDVVATLNKTRKEEQDTQRSAMLQLLLADRFQLKVHHETKDLPIYSLTIAKGGFKFKPADPNNTYANGHKGPDGVSHGGSMWMRDGQMTTQGVPLSVFASWLSQTLHRQVADNTGLPGNYDMTLRWSSDEVASVQQDPTTTSAPSIFTALQEQLGLKLESTKGPVDTIVIDHIEKPSAN
jgi:uncharacterized protein (TIGR03435 family)